MAWDSKTQIATSLSVLGTELFSSAVTLTPGESVVIQVDGDTNGTTDDLIVSVYNTLDDTSEAWDDTPVSKFAIDKDTDPHSVSITLTGLYRFRLGFVRDGSTDTWTTNAWYRGDGVSL